MHGASRHFVAAIPADEQAARAAVVAGDGRLVVDCLVNRDCLARAVAGDDASHRVGLVNSAVQIDCNFEVGGSLFVFMLAPCFWLRLVWPAAPLTKLPLGRVPSTL